MPPRPVRLDEGPHGARHATWDLPPERERIDLSHPVDHIVVRLLTVVLSAGGFVVRSFAGQAIDVMSLFVIESKGWIVFLVGQLLFALAVRHKRDWVPLDPDLRKVLTQAHQGRSCPVQIEVRQWGVVTGADQGLAWIEEDRLVFKGATTTFQTRRGDLLAWVMMSAAQRRSAFNRDKRTLPLPWGEDSCLFVSAINRYEDHGVRRRAARFDDELDAWLKGTPKPTRNPSTLPPRDVHPAATADHTFVVTTVVLAGILGLMDLAALFGPLAFDVHSALTWFEVMLRAAALAMLFVLSREVLWTLKTHAVRTYHLLQSRPSPATDRAE